jgi:putative DNA-invertase from lambdoid prophage Rac
VSITKGLARRSCYLIVPKPLFYECQMNGRAREIKRSVAKRKRAACEPQVAHAIITPELDRMFRSALNALWVLEGLKQRSVSLHLIGLDGDITGNGYLEAGFHDPERAVAEAERDLIPSARADRSRRRYLEAKPDALTSAGDNF